MTGSAAVSRRIVVLVDDTAASRAAVDWAAKAASRAGLALALSGSVTGTVGGGASEPNGLVASMARKVHHRFPDLVIEQLGSNGGLVADTTRAGNIASVVMGYQSSSLGSQRLSDGRLWELLKAAECTFIVTRAHGVRRDQPVIVGAEISARNDGLLEFAFKIASWQQSHLHVILSYDSPPAGTWIGAPPGLDRLLRGQATAQLWNAVQPWQKRYPDVTLTSEITSRSVRSALLRTARSASMLVVQSDITSRPGELVQHLVIAAPSPVAVFADKTG